MLGGYDGSIKIDSKIETKNFNTGVKQMTNSVKKMASVVATVLSVGAIVLFGKSAVNAASDLASAMTGLKSVLDGTGKSFSEAQGYIDSYIADGLIPATDAITAYKNLALRGYNTDQIEQVMTALKDSSAFGRQAGRTMGEAVAAATEGLRNENSVLVDNAGVTKNVAKMWQDYAESIGTTANNLTQQQKIQAEVNGILEETRFQTGDAAKLSQGYAGQVAAMGTSFYNLKVAVGNAIIPILTKIIPIIKLVIDWLVVLANQFAQFISALFGVQTGADAMAASTQKSADATQNQADATQKAEKAAKGALAAFDDLNVLQSDTGNTNPEAPAAPMAPVLDANALDAGTNALEGKVTAFKERLMALLEPASAALGRLVAAAKPLSKTVWEGLKWAWDNLIVPLGKWVITDALPAFLDLLAAGITALNAVLVALQPLGLWLWNEFLQPAAAWVGDNIIAGLQGLTDELYQVSDWITEHQKTVEAIAIVIGSFAAAWMVVTGAIALYNIAMGIAAVVTVIATSPILLIILVIAALIAIIVLLYTHWDDVTRFAARAWEWVKNAWKDAAQWFGDRVVTPVRDFFVDLWDSIETASVDAWDAIETAAGNAWEWIQNAWRDAGDWFQNNVINPTRDFFSDAWDAITSFPANAWTAIQNAWQGAASWFQSTVIDPIRNGFNTALTTIQNAFTSVFTGIQNFIRNAINTIIGFINGMILGMASGINSAIGGLNSLSINIPGWVPGIGGNSWGVNIPFVNVATVPYLATGAVIPPNSQFLAMLGDQKSGRNIEAPEGLIRQIIQEEMGNITGEFSFNFGGTLGALVRELKPYIDQENVRVGGSLITARVKS